MALVLSVELSEALDELAPVISLPVSLDVVASVARSNELVVSVWLVSVSQLLVVLWLESDKEKLPVIELPLCWLLSLAVPVELVTAVSVWFVSVALVLSVLMSVSAEA